MKKILAFVSILLVLVLAACGGSDESKGDDENTTIKVGATSVPHAEILEEAKPLLKEKGITLEIEEYQDYVLPNDALADGDLDANYFQTTPYLEQTVKDTGYDLDYIDGIHIEPMGIYSKDITSLDNVKDGTEVILSNSVSDHPRVLALFEKAGLIKLDDSVKTNKATFDDIVENPKNLTFSPDYEAAILPELYNSEENTLVAINTNYAIQAGLDPMDDTLILEDEKSPYVNVVAVQAKDKDNEALNTLVDVLHSKEIQDFMLDKYDGAVVPVGGEK
ncbi:methionine ABC transporter substrate-binding protein [Virgibacillus dakarensis]|uniref:Lipoprotein n=1 Tax=Lentibacillus populi TaxID=1827502 RepID=A0A9W5X4M0_9BACI|nr:MetQ/NlpA family ABC transporter substrate-binding protein [Lentibacillus populi]MBT2217594.1 MetQ/NlpA family ABC transporter substrate-binding protein [Virgibacillus dakarensis]MTW84714.1 methionine ABC transporter substrate-binding protein [Virgibacillus dakarensis]GGB36413.1 lipoprotein [Lentibacillus populi]